MPAGLHMDSGRAQHPSAAFAARALDLCSGACSATAPDHASEAAWKFEVASYRGILDFCGLLSLLLSMRVTQPDGPSISVCPHKSMVSEDGAAAPNTFCWPHVYALRSVLGG